MSGARMMFNVRIDATLQCEQASSASYASPGEAARATNQRLDARFRAGMQVHAVCVTFKRDNAPVLRRRYTAPRQETAVPRVVKKAKRKERVRVTRPASEQVAAQERESGMMVISARERATVELRRYEGDYYAFMMTHPLKNKKTDVNIGYATDPIHEIHRHNTLQTGDRSTGAAAPHWRAHMVLGPGCLGLIMALCRDWVDSTRGHDSKDKRGRFLAKIYDVPVYSADVHDAQPLERFLEENAPEAYQAAYKRLRQTPQCR